jgi:hypothetical protein
LSYFYLEVARTAASNKTLTLAQKPDLSCGGNACIYCGKCRDWDYNDDIEYGNNSAGVFNERRWIRSLFLSEQVVILCVP